MVKEDGSSVAESARRWVRYEKLNTIIDAEIAEEDEKYRAFLEQRQQGRWPKEYSPNYDEMMREDWWREQYRKANVEILDDRFEDALRLLLGETD
jgi:DNA phosphorothioation-dependent restriction protein DptG